MSLFTRIEKHLGTDSDAGGPVRGTFSIPRVGMIWLAANLVVTTLLTGTLFVPAVSFGTATAMILVGTLIGVVVLTMVGNMGTRTGLPTMATMAERCTSHARVILSSSACSFPNTASILRSEVMTSV